MSELSEHDVKKLIENAIDDVFGRFRPERSEMRESYGHIATGFIKQVLAYINDLEERIERLEEKLDDR